MHSAAPTKERNLDFCPERFLRLKASKQVGRERNSGVARAPSREGVRTVTLSKSASSTARPRPSVASVTAAQSGQSIKTIASRGKPHKELH